MFQAAILSKSLEVSWQGDPGTASFQFYIIPMTSLLNCCQGLTGTLPAALHAQGVFDKPRTVFSLQSSECEFLAEKMVLARDMPSQDLHCQHQVRLWPTGVCEWRGYHRTRRWHSGSPSSNNYRLSLCLPDFLGGLITGKMWLWKVVSIQPFI